MADKQRRPLYLISYFRLLSAFSRSRVNHVLESNRRLIWKITQIEHVVILKFKNFDISISRMCPSAIILLFYSLNQFDLLNHS